MTYYKSNHRRDGLNFYKRLYDRRAQIQFAQIRITNCSICGSLKVKRQWGYICIPCRRRRYLKHRLTERYKKTHRACVKRWNAYHRNEIRTYLRRWRNKNRGYYNAYYSKNKKRMNELARQRYRKNKEHIKETRRKRKLVVGIVPAPR